MRLSTLLLLGLALSLGACAGPGMFGPLPNRAAVGPATPLSTRLRTLPPLERPVLVAVYDFPDLTGAHRPSEGVFADYSKAVTQGAVALVVDALRATGDGSWFRVVERHRVDDLLKERKLIQDTYTTLKRDPKDLIAPLQFAEYLVEGGITGYDRSIVTGGAGATYLGIGPTASYKKDVVSISLRLASVRTGEVVKSISTSKTIYHLSNGLKWNRFASVGNLLEVTVGASSAEVTTIATKEAIELAVHELAQECIERPTWCRPRKGRP